MNHSAWSLCEVTWAVVGPGVKVGESLTQPCSVTPLIPFVLEELKATVVPALSGTEYRSGCILLCAARLERTPSAQETRNTRHKLAQPS